MNKRQAVKVKVGDELIGYKFGMYSPEKVTGIIETHSDPKAKVPLFTFENHPTGLTYLGLNVPK